MLRIVAHGRCSRTFSNYLGYARVGCLLAGKPDAVFDSPVLKRAKMAVEKRQEFVPRAKMYIQQSMIQDVMVALLRRPELRTTAMWMATSYAFMLRWRFVRDRPRSWPMQRPCLTGFRLSACR